MTKEGKIGTYQNREMQISIREARDEEANYKTDEAKRGWIWQ